jgi:hypothetical protein
MTEHCHRCDKPIATDADAETLDPGGGEHLCWGGCEPFDWRAFAVRVARGYVGPGPSIYTDPADAERVGRLAHEVSR